MINPTLVFLSMELDGPLFMLRSCKIYLFYLILQEQILDLRLSGTTNFKPAMDGLFFPIRFSGTIKYLLFERKKLIISPTKIPTKSKYFDLRFSGTINFQASFGWVVLSYQKTLYPRTVKDWSFTYMKMAPITIMMLMSHDNHSGLLWRQKREDETEED